LPDEQQYFPRRIALTRPQGEHVFEFAVVIRDQVGSYAGLIRTFSKHRIDIKSGSVDKMGDSPEFLAIVFADFSRADCTTEQVLDEIRSLSFVINAYFANMSERIFDRFVFPLIFLKGERIIIMGAGPLLNIERHLIEKFGSAGEAIMHSEGQSYASEVMKRWKADLPNSKPQSLMENIKDALRVTGWGVFDFRRLPDGFEVTVTDPPILEEADHKENRFYYGVASKILEVIHETRLKLVSSKFDPAKRTLIFKFQIRTNGM